MLVLTGAGFYGPVLVLTGAGSMGLSPEPQTLMLVLWACVSPFTGPCFKENFRQFGNDRGQLMMGNGSMQ